MKTVRIFVFLLTLGSVTTAMAHCEVPCGIYGDDIRFALLSEHLDTIEKAMVQSTELAAAETVNHNQLVRWTMTKEDHADKFREILVQYFLTQRIKPVQADAEGHAAYLAQLERVHQLVVLSMKCRQTTDTGHVAAARAILKEFSAAYTHKK